MCFTGVKCSKIIEKVGTLFFYSFGFITGMMKALCVELAKQVRVPSSRFLYVIVEVVQSVSPIVQKFGDGEWPFPWKRLLVGSLLV